MTTAQLWLLLVTASHFAARWYWTRRAYKRGLFEGYVDGSIDTIGRLASESHANKLRAEWNGRKR